MINTVLRPLLILPLTVVAITTAQAERTYKWVDEDGNVNYSNRLPPESSQHERKEINSQGRVLKVYEAPLSDEEKLEQARLNRLAAKKKERARQRATHDRSLLATYSSVEDMENARQDKVSLIEALVHLTNSRIKSMQERLLTLSEEAAQFERSGKKLPFTLQSQIDNLRDQIAHNKQFAIYKQAETEEIRQQFDRDIARFRELTADKSEAVKRTPTPLEIASRNPAITLAPLDRTLLATFSSVEDLLFARDEEIGIIDMNIRQAYERIESLQAQLAELSGNIDEYEADGENPPDTLLRQMKQLMAETEESEAYLQQQRTEKQIVLEQFEKDIQRFRVLTASN